MSSIYREDFIFGFSEIFPINGNMKNIISILDFLEIFPIKKFPINRTQLYIPEPVRAISHPCGKSGSKSWTDSFVSDGGGFLGGRGVP